MRRNRVTGKGIAQRGSIVIEAAFFLPLLLVVFLGGFELACLAYNAQVLSDAVHDGVRHGISFQKWQPLGQPTDTTCTQARCTVYGYVNQHWKNRMISFDGPGNITLTGLACGDVIGACQQDPIPAICSTYEFSAHTAVVTGQYSYTLATPFLRSIVGPIALQSQSVMRCE